MSDTNKTDKTPVLRLMSEFSDVYYAAQLYLPLPDPYCTTTRRQFKEHIANQFSLIGVDDYKMIEDTYGVLLMFRAQAAKDDFEFAWGDNEETVKEIGLGYEDRRPEILEAYKKGFEGICDAFGISEFCDVEVAPQKGIKVRTKGKIGYFGFWRAYYYYASLAQNGQTYSTPEDP